MGAIVAHHRVSCRRPIRRRQHHDVGDLMELDAVAACVIGGVSLRGGRGTVLGVLFGALIMACLLNGMTLLAVSAGV